MSDICITIGAGDDDRPVRDSKGKSLLEFPTDYVVLDLETTGLDPVYDEIIEVAAVRYRDGQPAGEYQSLIRPAESIPDFISSLTGITNDMVADAPDLAQVLPEFLDFIGDDILVGHNVPFDIHFLYDNSVELLGKPLSNDFVDTRRLDRYIYPSEPHHRLRDLKDRFGIQYTAHRAMGDVLATQDCFQRLHQAAEELHTVFTRTHKKLDAKDIVTDHTDFDMDSPIYGQTFAFTGTLTRMVRKDAMQMVVDRGGFVADNVTKKVNYLVLGNGDYSATEKSNKRVKAEKMQLDGKPIQVISENTFFSMIGE